MWWESTDSLRADCPNVIWNTSLMHCFNIMYESKELPYFCKFLLKCCINKIITLGENAGESNSSQTEVRDEKMTRNCSILKNDKGGGRTTKHHQESKWEDHFFLQETLGHIQQMLGPLQWHVLVGWLCKCYTEPSYQLSLLHTMTFPACGPYTDNELLM